VLADSQERELPELTTRDIRLAWIDGKVDAVIGMRRSGKTWLLYQRMAELMSEGVPTSALLYLNFEDERLAAMEAKDLHRIIDIFYRSDPPLRDRTCAFFFDEIQLIPGWETFVRRIVDTERAHVCVSGSSAKLLSREIASSLRGRAISTEVFPFSLVEALRHAGTPSPARTRVPGKRERARLERATLQYLEVGGFPEVQALDARRRRQILQDYVDVVILRDVIERHQVTNVVALRRMLRQLLNAPATQWSVHRLHNDLRSQGVAIGKDALYTYFDHLTDAYLLVAVEIHASSERVRQSNPRKVYPIDPGLALAFSTRATPDTGALLETAVCIELRRRGRELAYVRTSAGHEVDFLASDGAQYELIQVCAEMDQSATRERELRALHEATVELGVPQATIVTLHHDELVEQGTTRIRVMPFWRWTLGLGVHT